MTQSENQHGSNGRNAGHRPVTGVSEGTLAPLIEGLALTGISTTILNAIPDAAFIYDKLGRIVYANMVGRAALGLDAQPDFDTMPYDERLARLAPRDAQGSLLPREQWHMTRLLGGETITSVNPMDAFYSAFDGHEVFLSYTGAPLRNNAGEIVGAIAIGRDLTMRRHGEQRAQASLNALLAMARALVDLPHDAEAVGVVADAGMLTERAIAQRIAMLTASVLGCKRVSISAVEVESGRIRAVAVVGLEPEQETRWWAEQRAAEAAGTRLGDGASQEDMARFMAGEVFVLDMTKPPYAELPNPYGVTTTLVAPMRVGERLVGALSLDFGGPPHEFTRDEIALTDAVAQLGAVTLERERLLRERAEAQASALALGEANRRMDEFLGVAGHELRTPLTSAKANLQLAERRVRRMAETLGELGQQERERMEPTVTSFAQLIERTLRSTYRQERLVSDLLDISRIQQGKLELRLAQTDLAELTRETVAEQQLTNPSRAITLQLPRRRVVVMADADRLGQVITNFLSNALKYSVETAPVRVRLEVEGQMARLSVRDEGPGIPADELAHLWERFHRAANVKVLSGSGVGLGLGLYISRELIERHKGSVGVESVVGEGSTFSFTLPLQSNGTKAREQAQQEQDTDAQG